MALLNVPLAIRVVARPYVKLLLAFSLAINLLMLVSPVFMLQVYDRILTTGSFETLGWLTALALFLLAIYGIAEATRRRIFALAAAELGAVMAPRLFERFLDERSDPRLGDDLADLSRIEGALRGGALAPLFDLPFAPLYVAALFWVHPILGIVSLAGAAILIVGAILGRRRGQALALAHDGAEADARAFAAGLQRQRSAMLAMGMAGRTAKRLEERRKAALETSLASAQVQGATTGFSRSLRQSLQVLVLGIGAFYAVGGDVSAGAIVAGSILMGRLLMPIDQMVGGWQQLHNVREAWTRIAPALDRAVPTPATRLPRPDAKLELKDLSVRIGDDGPELIMPVNAAFEGGALIGLVGANGSGKTSLLQTLSGTWKPASGEAHLGGRSIHDWPSSDRGLHVGYLPQHIELLPGTITQNIARFEEDASQQAIFAAATAAGAHEAILSLADGYDSKIGPGGVHLSAGQAQLIGLARALFGLPPLLLLDEPGAHLDSRASTALIEALRERRAIGTLVIASTHDPAFLRRCDKVLVLANRRLAETSPETLFEPVASVQPQQERRA